MAKKRDLNWKLGKAHIWWRDEAFCRLMFLTLWSITFNIISPLLNLINSKTKQSAHLFYSCAAERKRNRRKERRKGERSKREEPTCSCFVCSQWKVAFMIEAVGALFVRHTPTREVWYHVDYEIDERCLDLTMVPRKGKHFAYNRYINWRLVHSGLT